MAYFHKSVLISIHILCNFPCVLSSHTVSIYTSNIEHVGCISIHCRALAIEPLNSEVVDFGSAAVDFLFIGTPIVGFCNCFMFCCTFLYVPSSFAIVLMGKRESWLLCLDCLPGVS